MALRLTSSLRMFRSRANAASFHRRTRVTQPISRRLWNRTTTISPFLRPAIVGHPPRRGHTEETDGIGSGATMEIINQAKDDDVLFVLSFSPMGFELSNRFYVVGPCILFPRTVLSWHVGTALDITPEKLAVFSLLEPRLDVLVIGMGDGTHSCDKDAIVEYCRRINLSVEILNTEEACSTFNFLNSEHRMVAAAMIPPENVTLLTPQLLVDEDFFDVPDDGWDTAVPGDPGHPKNWINPQTMKDNLIDSEMSKKQGRIVSRGTAREIRFTEEGMAKEIEAMEDRFTPHGERVVSELEKVAKDELEEDYKRAAETGELTTRIISELRRKGELEDEIPDTTVTEEWGSMEQSKRYRKKFAKLYDVGQDDNEKSDHKVKEEQQQPTQLEPGKTEENEGVHNTDKKT